MSDTPRTDAQTRDVFDGDGELPAMGSELAPGGFYVTADFARELEREAYRLRKASEAQCAEIRRLLKVIDDYAEQALDDGHM